MVEARFTRPNQMLRTFVRIDLAVEAVPDATIDARNTGSRINFEENQGICITRTVP